MEKVTIWYLTDNEQGRKVAGAIRDMRLTINIIEGHDLKDANIVHEEINIFIIDITGEEPGKLLEYCSTEQRIQGFLKFMVVNKKEIKSMSTASFNIYHLEFIGRPVSINEFLLLLEKSIIVERYREIMRTISRESGGRIEAYEGLMDINRKNIFESEKEKEAFENILNYEKNLLKEQTQLNKAIKDFTLMRHEELFDLKRRIHAEEMLSDLRRKELIDANNVINAQENVIDYSAKTIEETRDIFNATERVAELSRIEAIDLHEELMKEKSLNAMLSEEIERLLQELSALRGGE